MRHDSRVETSVRTTDGVEMGGSMRAFAGVTALVVGYVFIQLISNLTVLKTVDLVEGHAIAAGSLLFAVSYTWIDLVNQRLGPGRARILVGIAVVANLLMIGWFEVYLNLPGTTEWKADPSNQEAIDRVLGSVPRIYAASLLTSLVVENLDITIYAWLRRRRPAVPRWARSAISNTVSAPLDGVMFAVLAFAGKAEGSFVRELALTSAGYKLAVAYLSVPLVYLIRRRNETQ